MYLVEYKWKYSLKINKTRQNHNCRSIFLTIRHIESKDDGKISEFLPTNFQYDNAHYTQLKSNSNIIIDYYLFKLFI